MRDSFKKCAHCAGSGAAGVLMGHLGCIAAPAGMAALSAAGIAGGLTGSLVTVAAGAALTLAGLGAWYGLRGRFANAAERRVVIGSAAVGLALMTAFNLAGGEGHHFGHSHGNALLAEKWLGGLDAGARRQVEDNARALHMTPLGYAETMCLGPG
jgi:hypothetical protein